MALDQEDALPIAEQPGCMRIEDLRIADRIWVRGPTFVSIRGPCLPLLTCQC
jgi:hypothetical protein